MDLAVPVLYSNRGSDFTGGYRLHLGDYGHVGTVPIWE